MAVDAISCELVSNEISLVNTENTGNILEFLLVVRNYYCRSPCSVSFLRQNFYAIYQGN